MGRLRAGQIIAVLVITLAAVVSCQAGREPLPDFAQYTDVKQKKTAFFDYMLPLVVDSNQSIIEQRVELQQLVDSTGDLSFFQRRRLSQLANRYAVPMDNVTESEVIKTLLLRVAPIPPSLVLAQAAIESAWGTSRFARQGNNLFGQWCYKKGCGMVPLQRTQGSKHEVARFDNVSEAVEAYLHNLNTHRAYRKLRVRRAELAALNPEGPSGSQLAETLLYYSELREVYVHEVQAVIRINQLHSYDVL